MVVNGQDGGTNDEPAVPEDDFVKQRMLLVGLFQQFPVFDDGGVKCR